MRMTYTLPLRLASKIDIDINDVNAFHVFKMLSRVYIWDGSVPLHQTCGLFYWLFAVQFILLTSGCFSYHSWLHIPIQEFINNMADYVCKIGAPTTAAALHYA